MKFSSFGNNQNFGGKFIPYVAICRLVQQFIYLYIRFDK